MNDTVATKAQDTPTFATSPELAVVIGARTVEYHQGQRSYTAPTGRTYDRSRPKRSERRKPLAKRPSTYGKRIDVMNDTVATKAQDTPTFATSPELAVVIGTRTVEYHQGQRSYTAPTGRTYDRSRPKRSERRKPLAKRPSTWGRCAAGGEADARARCFGSAAIALSVSAAVLNRRS